MNSIFSNYFKQDFPKELHVIHHHKVEIIDSKRIKKPEMKTSIEKIKSIIVDILIAIGASMALVAGAALSLQSAGLSSPLLTTLVNFLMPGVAAILTAFHLSKKDFQTETSFLPTKVPVITFA